MIVGVLWVSNDDVNQEKGILKVNSPLWPDLAGFWLSLMLLVCCQGAELRTSLWRMYNGT